MHSGNEIRSSPRPNRNLSIALHEFNCSAAVHSGNIALLTISTHSAQSQKIESSQLALSTLEFILVVTGGLG